jgi:hypothetical protein|tara:strand:+ start:89 stop:655 length:567 start_codon:yes stop_codon:yes gene_type:complete
LSGIKTLSFQFPHELCDLTVKRFEEALLSDPIQVFPSSKPTNAMSRVDEFHFIDVYHHDDASVINEWLTRALEEYTNDYPILKEHYLYSIRIKCQKTPIGGGFHAWHSDNLPSYTRRILVWMIYLNDVEEGGETEFLYQPKRIKAEKGKIVIFPADFMHTHRGNPPISNEKYVLTGWFNIIDKEEEVV